MSFIPITSAEFVALLRGVAEKMDDNKPLTIVMRDAADRIEQAERERDEALDTAARRLAHIELRDKQAAERTEKIRHLEASLEVQIGLLVSLPGEPGESLHARAIKLRAERDRYWEKLCAVVEALGKIAPEAAPYAEKWAQKVREDRDRLRALLREALPHVMTVDDNVLVERIENAL